METPVVAPQDGTILTVDVGKGQIVQTGQLILTLS